jgi:hypothetical protein
VEAVQRRAARYVANNHRNRSSVSNIIQILKWRPLADSRKDARLSISTIYGASRFQSRTVLRKNDIFLVSIREDGIWNDLLCACLVFRHGGIIPPIRINEQAYFTLARPLVEYASTIWDPYTQTDINKVEAVQRRAARYVGI